MSSESGVADPPDLVLVARAAAGDSDAFTALFHRYQHVVYRFARVMTGKADAAEDITQEVFVAIYRDLANYDATRAAFTTYLYGIARNLTRARLRRERRFFPLDFLTERRGQSSYTADPSSALEDAQLASELRRALQKLPARYRELILLCDVHGLSYADAAIVAGLTTAAVRSRLHRGRQLLRRRLSRFAREEARRPTLQKGVLYEL